MSFQEPDGADPPLWSGWLVPAVVLALIVGIAAVAVIVLTTGSSPPPRRSAAGTTEPSSAPMANPTSRASAPAGGSVPVDFSPTSFTAISDSTWWLLGDAPCARAPCTSVVRTTDGGRSFQRIPAPRTEQVSELRFINARDGFAYGQGLWTTHDGGATWKQVPVSGPVSEIAASSGYVFAVGRFGLMRSPLSHDAWRVIWDGTNYASVWTQGAQIFIDDNDEGTPGLMTSTDHGTNFKEVPGPVGTISCEFATTGTPVIWAPCAMGLMSGVWRSPDNGAHWARVTPSDPNGGRVLEPNSAAFAAASGQVALDGSRALYRTTDAGASWTRLPALTDGVGVISYLGFTDPTHGVAIVTTPDAKPRGRLWLTTDAGASYRQVRIASS